MDANILGAVLLTFFIAAFFKGLTGLGFSTLCLGLLGVFVNIRLAIPIVLLPSLLSNIFVIANTPGIGKAVNRFWPMFLSALPGLLLGVYFLHKRTDELPKALLGAIIVLYGIWSISSKKMHLSKFMEQKLLLPVGCINGAVNGATGCQIMPLLPYMLSLKIDRSVFIQTINIVFIVNTIVMILALGGIGMFTTDTFLISAAGSVPVVVGVYLGGRIREKVDETVFRKMVIVLMILLGFNLIAQFMKP